jgi:hypothetical protein
MNPFEEQLSNALRAVAVLQIAIAVLNLFLVRILDWRADLERVPLLLKEVFQVHAWFISASLLIFGAVTWRFAAELAAHSNPLGRWLAAGIGSFWGLRTLLQITYYSSSHWRGRFDRTMIHAALLVAYGAFALTYFFAAIAPGGG